MIDLREKFGPDYYKNIRSQVKNHPGGAFNDPVLAKKASAKGVAIRQEKAKNKRNEDSHDLPTKEES